VIALLGNTCRVPVLCTVPIPWSIEISVASETTQRSVADCPRSIELGSAENCVTTGSLAAGGGVGFTAAGGGGGGAGGTLFLQLPATISRENPIRIALIFGLRDIN
jgi:hypothetical protein